MAPPGSTVVVAGDGKILDLQGWTVLNFEIAGQTLYHEVGVVKDLPLEFLIGGELMKPHACTLQYATTGRNIFHLGTNSCIICIENYKFLQTNDRRLLSTPWERHVLGKIKPLVAVCTEPGAITTT